MNWERGRFDYLHTRSYRRGGGLMGWWSRQVVEITASADVNIQERRRKAAAQAAARRSDDSGQFPAAGGGVVAAARRSSGSGGETNFNAACLREARRASGR